MRTKLSEEDLREVLEAGTRSGALDKTEHELISSIFEFTDTTAKEIMVPRPDIVALDIGMSRDVLLHTVIEEGYSRLPVYHGSIDNVIGIIYSKDLLSLLEYRDLIILQDIIRPAYFVHESKKISQLLREFQQKKVHLAIVIDEFGGTEGIITMEDILEEIVGEIHDEYDDVKKAVEQASDGSAIVDANISIHDFNEQFHAQIPDLPDYETLAGFLQKVTGKLPEINETIRQIGFSFTILSKTARRLRQVKVTPLTRVQEQGERA
ncbi:MAG: HlyC/CorC family transporter [Ignavibacteriales bacterium]|nr:HlyC/CorC family transporter [Ignavibacteriales bacterium]